MPFRHNHPMQRGYGPRMMSPRQQGRMPFGAFNQGHPPQMGGFGPIMGSTPRNPGSGFGPMMGRNQGNRGGGLLSKILGGRGKKQNGFPGAFGSMNRSAPSGGGGLLKAFTNPEGINGFLNNTQNVLKTAQQLGPIIQQYGPIVKNLPSMWKLYRGLKAATSETDNNTETQSETIDDVMDDIEESIENIQVAPKKKTKKVTNTTNKTEQKSQRSVPKLYI